MASSIIFIGKYDEELLKLEQKVIDFDNRTEKKNLEKQIIDNPTPDVVKYKINGYDCYAWIILGDVKPTILLKKLLSNIEIIFFCFNLSEENSLAFLNDGWGPIYEKAKNAIKDQKRFLIKTNANIPSSISEDEINSTKKYLDCAEIIKENELINYLQNNSILKVQIEDERKNKYSSDLSNMNDNDNKEEEDKNTNDLLNTIDIDEEKGEKDTNDLSSITDKNDKEKEEEEEVNVKYNSSNDNNDEIPKYHSNSGEINYKQEEELNDDDDEVQEEIDIEKIDQEINNIIKEKAIEFIDQKSVTYNLYENKKRAIIIKSQKAKNDVFIPRNVTYKSENYDIIGIGDKAFVGTKITSLSFSIDSVVMIIGNSAFDGSSLATLIIPKNFRKFNNLWCKGANELNEIEVEEHNRFFSIENGFLIYKNEQKHEILFAPRIIKDEFNVPEEIARIGNYSFYRRNGLTSIQSFSSNLQIIGSYSFSMCENLKNVVLKQDSNITIGGHCFQSSIKLSSIEIECNELKILENCFNNCKSLSSIKLNVSNKIQLCAEEFSNCPSLKDFSFINTNEILIGKECFSDSNNIKFVSFNKVNKINLYPKSFTKCNGLENISVNNANELKVGKECFKDLANLKSIGFITHSILLKDNFAEGCKELTFINIQCEIGSITIYSSALKSSKLKNIGLHSPKVKLCHNCFKGLQNLELIEINSDNLKIGENCFDDCPSLTSFILKADKKFIVDKNTFIKFNSLKKLKIETKSDLRICIESMSALKKLEEIVICGKIVVIEDSVFNNCESLTSVKINKSGTIRIGKNQFTNCKKLQTIDIDSTTEIGQNGPSTVEFGIFCFSGATKLKTFTIKGGEVKISNDCFKTCSSLTELYFLDVNTIVIEENQFSTCQSLNSVKIQSKNLINLGIGCFSNLKELKSVNLVGKYINIENSCFMNCTSLAVFVIDQTIDFTLKKGVFTKCDALKDINIGVSRKLIVVDESLNQSCLSSVTLQGKEITIGKECFKNCDYINKFTILAADTVELGTSAFENCKKFTEITVNAVASLTILDQCFYNDVNLKLINIHASEISIKRLAFSKCASIQFLKIEESIDKIVLNESAFSECTGLIQATFNSKENFQTHPNCFYNAKNLKTVLITSQKISINNSCFSNCSSMTSFTIWEAKNVSFATRAFDNCKSLEQIEVTASDEFKANTFCFNNNFKLKSVSFKCKKISIADKCFENCSALTRVNCPLETEIKCFTSAFKKNYQNYLVHPDSTKITTLTNKNDDDDKCSIF